MPMWLTILLTVAAIIFSWIWFFAVSADTGGKLCNFIIILGLVLLLVGIIALVIHLLITLLLFKILSYVSGGIALGGVFAIGYALYETIKYRYKASFVSDFFDNLADAISSFASLKIIFVFLIIALIGALVTNNAIHQWIGVGDIRLKPEGTYCYYVEVNGEVYPAQVCVDEITKEYNDRKKTIRYYYIEEIHFSKNSVCEFDCDPVEPNKSAYLYTESGESITASLLNKKAYSPYIEETNNANWINITVLCIEVLSIGLCLVSSCKELFDAKKSEDK